MIEDWEKLTKQITEKFLYDYFEDSDPHYDWVSNQIGGVFNYRDYWFSFDTVLACYRLGITEEQLLNWYYWCLENQSVNISLARYIESPKERKEQQRLRVHRANEALKTAEKEFKEAIEKYTE